MNIFYWVINVIIINKRKILFIIATILISFSFFLSNDMKKIEKVEEKIKLVNSVPVTNKVIIIDAGHGIPDGGAVGNNGTLEAEINLKIGLKLQKLLEESGAIVILTRSDENGIYEKEESSIGQKKVSDIKNRVKIGNESSADIYVSINLNKIQQQQYDGWQVFYKEVSEEGKELAENIQNALNETIEKENNRIAKSIDNIYIIKHVEIPTVIVECGFLSNYKEEEKLNKDEYQEKLAYGIYLGIMDYFYK